MPSRPYLSVSSSGWFFIVLSRHLIIVARSISEVRFVTIEPSATGISILNSDFITERVLSSGCDEKAVLRSSVPVPRM